MIPDYDGERKERERGSLLCTRSARASGKTENLARDSLAIRSASCEGTRAADEDKRLPLIREAATQDQSDLPCCCRCCSRDHLEQRDAAAAACLSPLVSFLVGWRRQPLLTSPSVAARHPPVSRVAISALKSLLRPRLDALGCLCELCV